MFKNYQLKMITFVNILKCQKNALIFMFQKGAPVVERESYLKMLFKNKTILKGSVLIF